MILLKDVLNSLSPLLTTGLMGRERNRRSRQQGSDSEIATLQPGRLIEFAWEHRFT